MFSFISKFIDRQALLALMVYSILCLTFFGKDVVSHGIASGGIGGGAWDIVYFAWVLEWWRYSFLHLLNPFYTTMIFAARGIDLSWNPLIMPTFGIILMPLTIIFGAIQTANILLFLLPVLAAFSVFVLCHHLTKAFLPSLLAGYIFGFSSYMQDAYIQSLPNTGSIFLIPILVFISLRLIEGNMKTSSFVIFSTTILSLQFGIFPETCLTMVLFGLVFLAICFTFMEHRNDRIKILRLTRWLFVSSIFSFIIISPELYAMLVKHYYSGPKFGWSRSDLLSFLIPNYMNMIGGGTFRSLSQKFVTGPWSVSGYLGLPLFIVIILFFKKYLQTLRGKILSISFLAIFVSSLGGPTLLIAGAPTISMPWKYLMHVPLLDDAQPHRFTLYLFLIASVMVAQWTSDSSINVRFRWLLSLLIIAFLIPVHSGSTLQREPSFFSSGLYAKYFSKGDNVFIVSDTFGMQEQLETHFFLKIPDGISEGPDTTSSDPDQKSVSDFLREGKGLNEPRNTLSRFFIKEHVKAIVATQGFRKRVDALLRPLGLTSIDVQDVKIYIINSSDNKICC